MTRRRRRTSRFSGCLVSLFCFLVMSPMKAVGAPLQGTLESEFGCTLQYERHIATEPEGEALEVMLAHGFMRSLKNMRGWALHWQSQGISTTLVSFCNSTAFNGHHARNAADMVALRKQLGLHRMVYAGFSAGGLAAYLAALEDSAAQAYLGLDPVDSASLATSSSRVLSVPNLFLIAQPSMCNARNNFAPVTEKNGHYETVTLEAATHCHFEWPQERRCGWLCGRKSPEEDEVALQEIRMMATQWLQRL